MILIYVEKKLEWKERIYSTSKLNSNDTSGCFFKRLHRAERNKYIILELVNK